MEAVLQIPHDFPNGILKMALTIFTQTNVSDDSFFGNSSIRNVLKIIGGAQDQIRVTFTRIAGATGMFTANNVAIGISASDPLTNPDTTATPVELLFSGGHGFSLTANQSITSDWANLSGFTSSNFLVVILDVAGTNSGPSFLGGQGGGNFAYFNKAGASYTIQTTSGFSRTGGVIEGVSLIETQSAGGDNLSGPMNMIQMKRKSLGWTPPLVDHRRRQWRRNRSLLIPSNKLWTPKRAA